VTHPTLGADPEHCLTVALDALGSGQFRAAVLTGAVARELMSELPAMGLLSMQAEWLAKRA
jgi:predicted NAD/FAD-dependent oxidoreductase